MSTHRRPFRSIARIVALATGFAALPLASGQDPTPPGAAPFAVVLGRVKTKGGDPLPGVRVRAAVPAADMRFVHPGSGQVLIETLSGPNGEYRLEFPGVGQKTAVSLDALMPGFERLVGTLMAGGDARRVDVEPGAATEANLALNPALYFRGTVVDAAGQPIPSVQVNANLTLGRGTGGIERTATAPDGSFEVFGYPTDPNKFGNAPNKGPVSFSHPDYIAFRFDDVYTIEPDRRGELRVILDAGRKVMGTVLDAEGQPVARALVETEPVRKATLTDAEGKFALRGLTPGPTTLRVQSLEIKQKASLPLTLEADREALEVRLGPIVLPANIPRTTVLGMELTDVTPELKSAYDGRYDKGALILDPGLNPDRLKIGQCAEGDVFWMVGQKRIGSVREFVQGLLAETANGVAEVYSVRVVYGFKTVEFVGTNTQYLKFTRADREALQVLADQLKAKAP